MFGKLCKNCFETYSGKPEICPHCGAALHSPKQKKTKEKLEVKNNTEENSVEQVKPKKEKKVRKKIVSSKEIMDSIDFVELHNKASQQNGAKSKRNKDPEFKVEKNGEYSVDISDVTYLPSTYTYSAKKARGEFDAPKIKWWEIYKWADILLARRKIKKQVKKASYYRPQQFNKGSLLTLCIFFGWMGGHNFYARNYRKATFMLISVILGSFVALAPYEWTKPIKISIGGGLLFMVLCMWVLDLINIVFNTFSYRLSKWKFIDSLNYNSRATLGSKYIDKDEYKKPWIVRVINDIKEKSAECKAKRQQEKEIKEQTKDDQTIEADKPSEQVATVKVETRLEDNSENKKEKPKNKQNKKAKVVIKKKK